MESPMAHVQPYVAKALTQVQVTKVWLADAYKTYLEPTLWHYGAVLGQLLLYVQVRAGKLIFTCLVHLAKVLYTGWEHLRDFVAAQVQLIYVAWSDSGFTDEHLHQYRGNFTLKNRDVVIAQASAKLLVVAVAFFAVFLVVLRPFFQHADSDAAPPATRHKDLTNMQAHPPNLPSQVQLRRPYTQPGH